MTVLKKISSFLRTRAQSGFFAAFAPLSFQPLASVEGTKLASLYSSNQNLGTYINSLFKMAIAVGAIIAVIRLLIAGYMYMGGDIWHTKQQAKETIVDVLVGLALLLSVWIILHQINPSLLNLNIALPRGPSVTAVEPPKKLAPISDKQKMLDAILSDEEDKRALLQRMNIGVNKKKCTVLDQRECTNVGLLGPAAIGGLQVVKANCRCSVTVSGGTEFWLHATHRPNSSVVDISKNNAVLNKYIVNNAQQKYIDSTFIKGQNIEVYVLDGAKYYSENSAHWHVVY